MLQVKNETPFEPGICVFPNKDGVDCLYVMVKAMFSISPRLSIADEQAELVQADEFYGEPGFSSVKYASDYHIGKVGTDVVLIGSAWPDGGGSATRVDTVMRVANRQKNLRVYGDRVIEKGVFGLSLSDPEPFQSLPLVYERAFGGQIVVDPETEKTISEPRNPVGVGIRGKRSAKELNGTKAPNIEDPGSPFKGPADRGTPASYGFVAANWEPRLSFAGTYDDAWLKSRAPYLPRDFDHRFFNAASPDFVFSDHLKGGEPVELLNLSFRGPLRFKLPQVLFDVRIKINRAVESVPLNCELVQIEPDENRLCMVWKGAYPCDKKSLSVEEIRLSAQSVSGLEASR